MQQTPTVPCRQEVEQPHKAPCEATESTSAIHVRFTPTLGANIVGVSGKVIGATSEAPFFFHKADVSKSLYYTEDGAGTPVTDRELYGRSDMQILIKVDVR